MATNKDKLLTIWNEFQRTVGMIENKVESKTVDAFITMDELDVSQELKARLRKLDLNGDGKLTLEELQKALKTGLDPETAKLVKDARETVNSEIMQLYSEAMEHYSRYKTRLEALVATAPPDRYAELMDRSGRIDENLNKIMEVLKRKPEAMNLLRAQIRDFIKDVKALEKAGV